MRDARDVYGIEAQEACAFLRGTPTICVKTSDGRETRFYRVANTEEPREYLQIGWYQASGRIDPRGGWLAGAIVLHWTRKADVLTEVGALLAEREV